MPEHTHGPPAADSLDGRKRMLKHQLAAAETAGDSAAIDELRAKLASADAEIRSAQRQASRESAAALRREAAKDESAVKTPPAGRSAPAKATTAKG